MGVVITNNFNYSLNLPLTAA